jgi:filamentous hemagglutinin family protein
MQILNILYILLFTNLIISCLPVHAQIIPDETLNNNSKVTVIDNADIITGGTVAGGNLFHSFEQFSVPTGKAAYFNNDLSIQNIISRVTGSSISNIDGILQANGTSNLFLINPNGIIFGPNASLNIGGSFLASTANSLNFADGSQFNATNPQTTSLLTISVPVGLQFSTNPRPIQVNGYGHSQLIFAAVGSPIYGSGQSLSGLKTQPGKTIALVGGAVTLDGGLLTAPSGRVEIGSVASGLINLSLADTGLFLNYDNIQDFKDIYLNNQALVDASGLINGNISLQGKNITLTQKSLTIVSNFGSQPSGEININASDKLTVVGVETLSSSTGADVGPARGIVSQNFSSGKGADIAITSNQLIVQDFGVVVTHTFGSGLGGNIDLVVKDSARLFSSGLPTTALTLGTVSTFTSGEGNSGNLKLVTKTLSIENGSIFTTQAFRDGGGGNITVNATDSVEVIGGHKITFNQSFIDNSFWSSTLGTLATYSGKAGDVEINTNRLSVSEGGGVGSSTVAFGAAGKLTINATDSIDVRGRAIDLFPSQITSSASLANPFFQQVFNLPSNLLGEAGQIDINTNRLIIQDGAQVSVRNDGEKSAGALTVNANNISLDNQAGITATTAIASGEGGNIFLQTENLQLRQTSPITASAGGSGRGGNVSIQTGTLLASENSDISANSVSSQGGKVAINAQAIFGTEFRNRLSPESDITATGGSPDLEGTVQINAPDTAPSQGTFVLPEQIVDVSGLVTQGCPTMRSQASKFVITGRGGLPEDPNKPLERETIWTDSRPITTADKPSSSPHSPATIQPANSAVNPLVEASGWMFNPKGEVVLIAASPNTDTQIPHQLKQPSCHAS